MTIAFVGAQFAPTNGHTIVGGAAKQRETVLRSESERSRDYNNHTLLPCGDGSQK
jgi:hypothetical protein